MAAHPAHSCVESVSQGLAALESLAQALSDHAVTMAHVHHQEQELLEQLAAAGLRVQGARIVRCGADGAPRVWPADDPGGGENGDIAGPAGAGAQDDGQRWAHRLHMLRTNSGYAASRLRQEAVAARAALEAVQPSSSST